MKKKIFCFDLDNTICITKGKQYSRSKPIEEAIILINKLYSEGHVIKIFTSRYMGRNKDNINKAYKKMSELLDEFRFTSFEDYIKTREFWVFLYVMISQNWFWIPL